MASAALGPQLRTMSESSSRIQEAAVQQEAEAKGRGAAAFGQVGQAVTGALQQRAQIESTEEMQQKVMDSQESTRRLQQNMATDERIFNHLQRSLDRIIQDRHRDEDKAAREELVDKVIVSAAHQQRTRIISDTLLTQTLVGAMGEEQVRKGELQGQVLRGIDEDIKRFDNTLAPIGRTIDEIKLRLPSELSVQDIKDAVEKGGQPGAEWLTKEFKKLSGDINPQMFLPEGRDELIKKWEANELPLKDLRAIKSTIEAFAPHLLSLAGDIKVGIKPSEKKEVIGRRMLSKEEAQKLYGEEGEEAFPDWFGIARAFTPLLLLATEKFDITVEDVEGKAAHEIISKDADMLLSIKSTFDNWLPQQTAVSSKWGALGKAIQDMDKHYTGTSRGALLKKYREGLEDDTVQKMYENSIQTQMKFLLGAELEQLTPKQRDLYKELFGDSDAERNKIFGDLYNKTGIFDPIDTEVKGPRYYEGAGGVR